MGRALSSTIAVAVAAIWSLRHVSRVIWSAGTASSQTVRQMPVVRLYQIACGSSFQSCLPRGMRTSNGSSSARTTIACSSPSASASVMSALKGVCPPSCVATSWPSTHTRAR